jgi:hypothetical protein
LPCPLPTPTLRNRVMCKAPRALPCTGALAPRLAPPNDLPLSRIFKALERVDISPFFTSHVFETRSCAFHNSVNGVFQPPDNVKTGLIEALGSRQDHQLLPFSDELFWAELQLPL